MVTTSIQHAYFISAKLPWVGYRLGVFARLQITKGGTMAERDAKGRFVAGNTSSGKGGRMRAARQTPAERAALARSGLEAVAAELGCTPEEAAKWLSERGTAALRRKWAAEAAPSQDVEAS